MLKPLPHFHDRDNCEDEASSDSDDENSGAVSNPDDNDGQNVFFAENFASTMPPSNHAVRSYHCDQSMSGLIIPQRTFEIDRMDCIYSSTTAQKNGSSTNPAAAIDIMESETTNHCYSQQAYNRYNSFFQLNDSPSINDYTFATPSKAKLVDDLMTHLASISPTVLVRDTYLPFIYWVVLSKKQSRLQFMCSLHLS